MEGFLKALGRPGSDRVINILHILSLRGMSCYTQDLLKHEAKEVNNLSDALYDSVLQRADVSRYVSCQKEES